MKFWISWHPFGCQKNDVLTVHHFVGAVYICTENLFPIKRLQQLISDQSALRSDLPPSLISTLKFSDRVYVEHAADLVSVVSLSVIGSKESRHWARLLPAGLPADVSLSPCPPLVGPGSGPPGGAGFCGSCVQVWVPGCWVAGEDQTDAHRVLHTAPPEPGICYTCSVHQPGDPTGLSPCLHTSEDTFIQCGCRRT